MSAPIQIIGGKEQGHLMALVGQFHRLEIRYKNNPKVIIGTIPLVEITSLEPLVTQTVNAGDTAVFGTLGFLVGGPVGAAAGAGLSRLSRECDFVITTTSGDKYICRGWRKFFDLMITNRQIALASPVQSAALAQQNLPDTVALQTTRSELNKQPAPFSAFWKWFWGILVVIILLNLFQ